MTIPARRASTRAKLQKGMRLPIIAFRRGTARLRLPPDFIVIGAQRCGTTSFFEYLKDHPGIEPAWHKELNYFALHYQKGPYWYRSHFPPALQRSVQERRGRRLVTGEASPYYLFHPHAARRVAQFRPDIKLIVLLRDPVERAYSHYNHAVFFGREHLSFAEALAKEEERLQGELERMLSDEHYRSAEHQFHAYVGRGIYVDQLENWMTHFPREQLLVLKSEDLYTNPASVVRQTVEFLGLPSSELAAYPKHNSVESAPMDDGIRQHLCALFEPHNRRLYDFLGMDLGWSR